MASAKSGSAPQLETYTEPTAALDACDDSPGSVESPPPKPPEKQAYTLSLTYVNSQGYQTNEKLTRDSQD